MQLAVHRLLGGRVRIIGFLGEFFAMMGKMGAELFKMSWVQAIVLFFSYLAWALYGTGLVVSAFECGIEYQSGRGNLMSTMYAAQTAMNITHTVVRAVAKWRI